MHDSLWQDWVNAVLGVWLFFSLMIGFGELESALAWNAHISGLAMAVGGITSPQRFAEWVTLRPLGGPLCDRGRRGSKCRRRLRYRQPDHCGAIR